MQLRMHADIDSTLAKHNQYLGKVEKRELMQVICKQGLCNSISIRQKADDHDLMIINPIADQKNIGDMENFKMTSWQILTNLWETIGYV